MRALDGTLEADQKADSLIPLVKIVLTHGETTYTYESDRILDVTFTQESDRQNATVLLDNSDKAFTNLDLKGFQGVISVGVTTDGGDEYSPKPKMKVIAQELPSSRGGRRGRQLTCTLMLAGIPNQLEEDRAEGEYAPDEDDTKTVKTHIREIFGDSGVSILDVYDHCDSYDIVFGDEEGKSVCDLLDSYKPRESYSIQEGSSRMERINKLLSWTECVIRFEDDGLPHIFKPTTSGAVFDYEYELASGEHIFFAKSYRERLVIPNKIIVRSLLSQDSEYEGSATDTDSFALMPKTRWYRFRVDNNGDCDDLAEAILARFQADAERGYGYVPMNVGAEVHDYVQIIDSREGETRTGNIKYLSEHINLQEKVWEMWFHFGSPDPTSLLVGAPPAGTSKFTDYILELFEMMGLVAQRTILFGVAGTLIAEDNASFEIPVPYPLHCERVYINVKTTPTGAQVIVDVNLNGATIFSTQANRPKITPGLTVAQSGKPNTVVFRKNDILSIDIDQIGSSNAGADLIVELRCKLRGF